MSFKPAFTNQQGFVIKPSIYLKQNTPADKFPAFQPPKNVPPGASYIGFITPPPSQLGIQASDFIAQPKDTFGMKVQEYFSARESYLRTMGIVQQLLARQKAQYEAELQLVKTRQLFSNARAIRNDVRGLTENMALRFVQQNGPISTPAQLQRNDINALVRASVPTSVPTGLQNSSGASSKSLPEALAEAENAMGGVPVGERQQEVMDALSGVAQASADEGVKLASARTSELLEGVTQADEVILDTLDQEIGQYLSKDQSIDFDNLVTTLDVLRDQAQEESITKGIPISQTDYYPELVKGTRQFNAMAKRINAAANKTIVNLQSPLGSQITTRRSVRKALMGQTEAPARRLPSAAASGTDTLTQVSTYSNPIFSSLDLPQ